MPPTPIVVLDHNAQFGATHNKGYRPSQWATKSPAAISPPLTIFLPAIIPILESNTTTVINPIPIDDPEYGAGGETAFFKTDSGFKDTPAVLYVFDNALQASHEQDLTITQNPVQTQASISDHSYIMPARLTIVILMSDAMESYVVDQFSGTQSRSVSAYKTLIELQQSQRLLVVATRLRAYSNMLITNIRPEDNASTRYGLKCNVTFQEVLLAEDTQALNSGSSAKPQVTNNSPTGPVQTTAPSTSVEGGWRVATAADTQVNTDVATAANDGKSDALTKPASANISAGAKLANNINQFPKAIQSFATAHGLSVAGATNSISSLPQVINSLGRSVGIKIPPSVLSPVTQAFSLGGRVNGAGDWSSNSVVATLSTSISRL